MKKLLIILFIILLPAISMAAPSVSGVSGTLDEGESITITGSSFGSHTLDIESLHDYIEAGTRGTRFSRSGWDANWDADWPGPSYVNDSYHSGTKSLKSSVNTSLNWNSIFSYDMTNVMAGQRFYATWWVKWSGATSVQWKMFRASGNKTIVDGSQEAVLFNWLSGSRQLVVDPGTSNDQTFWPSSSTFPLGDNNWYRVELNFLASSTNQYNGVLTVSRYTNGGTITSETFSGVRTHVSTGNNWGHAIWQNYIGNGSGSATIWFDDVYVQYNTQARVEICSNSSWSSRGKCEIQEPTAWSTSSISAKVNTGNFADQQTVYVYVVDSAGTYNTSGYPVIVGEGGGDSTPPVVTISTPDPSNITSDSLAISGIASDANGVSQCKYRIGAAPTEIVGTVISGTTSWSGTATGFSQGANTLYVGCDDPSNNWGSDSITINLDSIAPTLSSVTIASSGLSVVFDFDEAITESGTGSDWTTFNMSGGAVALSSPNVVSDTITYTMGRKVYQGETLYELDYTQPGNGIEDIADNDLASINNFAGSFTNGSIQIPPQISDLSGLNLQ